MADFYPLIANTAAGQIQEIPNTANLNLSGCNVINTGTYYGSGAGLTDIPAGNISSGTLDQARLANSAVTLGSTALTLGATVTTVAGLSSVTSTTFVGALTGAATTAGTVTTAAQPNVTSVGTLVTLSVAGNIATTGGNGVANIGAAGAYFNTVHAKATSAQYADLAEMYQGDQTYMPGTVVEFGGAHEVTITTSLSSVSVAGVVSTNPSYLMNSGLNGLNTIPVALTGRVPCRVIGPVKKGDRLVSSVFPGVAQALDEETYQPGCIIGKSLEDWTDTSIKLIEVVVGRV